MNDTRYAAGRYALAREQLPDAANSAFSRIVRSSQLLEAEYTAVVMTAPLAVRSEHDVWLLFPVLTLIGTGMVLTNAAETALMAAAVPDELRGDFNGLVRTSFGARIDYEFLRNLIFYVEPKYMNEDFPGTSRKDKVGKVSAGFDYLLNRNAKVGLRYDFIDRNSTLSSFTYDEHVVTFNVTTQY